MNEERYQEYYKRIKKDIEELRKEYPFTKEIIIPTMKPSPIELIVIAANRELIEECMAKEEDFIGDYSRKIKISVPFDYQITGCNVYGAEWLEFDRIPPKDRHFYEKKDSLYRFCVGVPQSFGYLDNVLLENVRTAENMLIAYENFQRGNTDKIELLAYSHGEKGKNEYRKNRNSYRTK